MSTSKRKLRVKCDGCDACFINGIACHEQGCYQWDKPWVEIDGYVIPADNSYDNYYEEPDDE